MSFVQQAGLAQALPIAALVGFHIPAQAVEKVPGIDPGIVAIVETQRNGVAADRLDGFDIDVLLAGQQLRLGQTVSANLGRRRMGAQILAVEFEGLAVGKLAHQHPAGALQSEFGHNGVVHCPLV